MRAAAALAAVLAVLTVAARAEPFGTTHPFNAPVFAAVTGTAFAFMAPRTLDPIPIPEMAIRGLRSLSTLDRNLVAELHGNGIALLSGANPMLSVVPPVPTDAIAWGAATAEITRAAWNTSAAVRQAGNAGVTRAFFDELLSHLDAYSRYLPPQEAAEEMERRAGSAGIGVRLVRRGRAFVVVAVAPNSPAFDAAIQTGDSVLQIDDDSTQGQSLDDVTAALAGPEGSAVMLRLRARNGRVRDVTLQRALIPEQTVLLTRTRDLVTIRITSFADETADQLRTGLLTAVKDARGLRGVVLDLRGNRGGVLRQAIAAAELLVAHGLLARTMGRDPAADHDFQANGEDLANGLPVVVLVDGQTASSAEILAAALANRGRAVVVGSSTLGKGLVQTVTNLPDGGELFVTWSRVLAPAGWPIQALGVLPQVCTSLGRGELEAELRSLKDGREPLEESLARRQEARPTTPPMDIIAIREACPAAEGRDSDMTVARFLLENPGAYATALLEPAPE
ncbi:MAG TPA: S41 family peptidase [Acetobacteraceae bacterium]|nr:S41 family peptidase [Acetobacteraceae bacterium]